ncbi:hypothetical protein GW17_00057228, partial [Ensete ventricosum]
GAVAAKLKEAASALGAGVGALGNHEVYEAGHASGGNEDLATAGLRAGIRCRGGREGGKAGVDAVLVVVAAADSGTAVKIIRGDVFPRTDSLMNRWRRQRRRFSGPCSSWFPSPG